MKIISHRKVSALRPEDIDFFSEWLTDMCDEVGVDRQNCIRVRLYIEDLLLSMREHLGDDARAVAFFDTRLGRPRLRFEIRGEAYNPLVNVATETGEWDSLLRTAIGTAAQYNYDGVDNILRLSIPYPGMNPVLRLVIAILLGVGVGIVGRNLLSADARLMAVEVLLTPIYNLWTRMLNAISGPIVFLTVITTMLNTRRIEERGGSGRYVVTRYFALSIFVVVFASLCAFPFHPLPIGGSAVDRNLVIALFDAVLQVVPSNIFDPFVESNTSQLLFLAFALGYVLTRINTQVSSLTELFQEANVVGLKIAEWASYPVAIFVGFFVCMEIIAGQLHLLSGIWRPLGLSIILTFVVLIATMLSTAGRMRVSPVLLLRKIWKPFAIALRTGSLNESFGEVQLSCVKMLGIDRGYTKEALPQGLVLYMPISTIGTIVFTVFTAHMMGVQANIIWYISAIVMAVVVFVATPPVPGANLLAYVVLFSTLGISADALLDAMIFDVVFGILAGAGNQTMLQFEMIVQANRFGVLDKDRLRAGVKA